LGNSIGGQNDAILNHPTDPRSRLVKQTNQTIPNKFNFKSLPTLEKNA
jgi:hypothetical protein